MPTYEYECSKCGHTFERFQSMNEEPVKRCPKCRCKVRRLLGVGAGIIFKGSGFYETDYKRKESRRVPETSESSTRTNKQEAGSGSAEKPASKEKTGTADR